jgi:hypothetical protein
VRRGPKGREVKRRLSSAAFLLGWYAAVAHATVSTDANGFTVVTPSGDSRLIYVSAGGNDVNSGLTSGLPKKTLAAAGALLRTGFPDWMQLDCTSTWTGETFPDLRNLSGRSTSEPMVFTYYGSSCTQRPIAQTDGTAMGSFFGRGGSGTTAHIAILGIDLYDRAKDPAAGGSGTAPNVYGVSLVDGGNDILIEDCRFRFLFVGASIQYVGLASPSDITLRRNVVTDEYNGGSCGGHAQGYYLNGLTGSNHINENWFANVGWNVAGGCSADVFNHATYIADSTGMEVKGNYYGTDSSLAAKFVFYGGTTVSYSDGMDFNDNFGYEGEIGLSLAVDSGAACFTGANSCYKNASIRNNVWSQTDKSNPTARGLGWGMELKSANTVSVHDNICTDFSHVAAGNTFCIAVDPDTSTEVVTGVTVGPNNIGYRIKDAALSIQPKAAMTSTIVTGNYWQDPDQGGVLVDHGSASFTGVTYSANVYSPTGLTHLARINGTTTSYSSWLTSSSETGSANTTVSYPAPLRTLDTYAVSLGMADAAAFETAIRSVGKLNWHPEYLGAAIVDYARAGYGLAPVSGGTFVVGKGRVGTFGGF